MVLESLDGPLGGTYTVVHWFHELPSASPLLDVFFDRSCGLVVHHNKCQLDALLFLFYEHLVKCINYEVVLDVSQLVLTPRPCVTEENPKIKTITQ